MKTEHHCPNCNVLISSGKNLCHACDLELYEWQQKRMPRYVASNPTRQDSDIVQTSTQQQGKVWDEKAEHENDLRYESRQDYEQDQLAGNPPEYSE